MTLPHPMVFLVDVNNAGRRRATLSGRASRSCGDKLSILTAAKKVRRARVATVLPRQGEYALDAKVMSALPPAGLTVERLGDLLDYDLARLRTAALHPT
jgi:hypothetical protein